jgi:hypothetical protein
VLDVDVLVDELVVVVDVLVVGAGDVEVVDAVVVVVVVAVPPPAPHVDRAAEPTTKTPTAVTTCLSACDHIANLQPVAPSRPRAPTDHREPGPNRK